MSSTSSNGKSKDDLDLDLDVKGMPSTKKNEQNGKKNANVTLIAMTTAIVTPRAVQTKMKKNKRRKKTRKTRNVRSLPIKRPTRMIKPTKKKNSMKFLDQTMMETNRVVVVIQTPIQIHLNLKADLSQMMEMVLTLRNLIQMVMKMITKSKANQVMEMSLNYHLLQST